MYFSLSDKIDVRKLTRGQRRHYPLPRPEMVTHKGYEMCLINEKLVIHGSESRSKVLATKRHIYNTKGYVCAIWKKYPTGFQTYTLKTWLLVKSRSKIITAERHCLSSCKMTEIPSVFRDNLWKKVGMEMLYSQFYILTLRCRPECRL